MRTLVAKHSCGLILTLCVFLGGLTSPEIAHAFAGDRNYFHTQDGASETWKVTSLGDSIAAGYCGIPCVGMDSYVQYYAYRNDRSIARVQNVNIDGRAHAVSGYTSKQILEWIDHYEYEGESGVTGMDVSRDVAEADVITIEGCGNDYIPGRKAFKSSCNEGELRGAIETCKHNMEAIYVKVLKLAKPGARVRVMNIYYPGMHEDALGQCNGRSNADTLLAYFAEGNYYTCEIARKYNIPCADAFSLMNSADEDRAKISWIPGESLESYKERLTMTHRNLITDPSQKKTAQGIVNWMQKDDTHPTKEAHSRLAMAHWELGMAPTK